MQVEPGNDRFISQLAAAEAAVGNYYGEIGLWKEAAGHFARAFVRQPSGDGYNWVTVANVTLFAGDMDTYRQVCTQALQRYGENPETRLLSDLSAAIALAPEPIVDGAKLVEMSKQVLAVEPKASWRHSRIALAQYRAGQLEEALASIKDYSGSRETWPLAAMIHHRLGQRERRCRSWRKSIATRTKFSGPLSQQIN